MNTPRTGGGCRHETHDAAGRAAALGGPRGCRAPVFARCLRIASTTSCSVMNAITFISEPQGGQPPGFASCGIERWGQRAGNLARVLRKHPVVVSRWVSEGNRLRVKDQEFSAALEALDKALSLRALELLRANRRPTRNRTVNPRIQRAGDQESLESFPWHRYVRVRLRTREDLRMPC